MYTVLDCCLFYECITAKKQHIRIIFNTIKDNNFFLNILSTLEKASPFLFSQLKLWNANESNLEKQKMNIICSQLRDVFLRPKF